jgi:DNA uptake protein ComE-like DNA-binding protein
MWKDFFYYSKSERRAVFALSFLIVCLLVAILLAPEKETVIVEEPLAENVRTETDKVEADSFQRVVEHREKKAVIKKTETPSRKVVLAPFDPNLADSIELLDLGLSPYVARNVLRYREKGGRFRTPESFARIYGLTEEQFETLRPYIRISESFRQKTDTSTYVRRDTFAVVYKYPKGTLVDVGVADTTELKKIPGIGSGISKAIVGYRNRLGGFYSLEQLREVRFVTPEMMEWFKLDSISIRPLPVNRAGLDRLRNHPYLNFYQAKVILEHRKKHGEIKSLSQLSLYEEFTEKDLKRLFAYFSFD